MTQKLICFLVIVCLLFTILPMAAFAEEIGAEEQDAPIIADDLLISTREIVEEGIVPPATSDPYSATLRFLLLLTNLAALVVIIAFSMKKIHLKN